VSSAAAAEPKRMEANVGILALRSPSLEPLRAYIDLNSGVLCESVAQMEDRISQMYLTMSIETFSCLLETLPAQMMGFCVLP
jgi:hypothetical protein